MALAGKHAFVTGGGRGIGRAVAAALARAGAAVTVIGRTEAPLRAAVAAGEAAGCGVADVTDVVEVKRQVMAAEAARGPIAILINNAGSVESGPFIKADPSVFRAMWNVHLMGAVYSTQAVLPGMIERGFGRIVNVASTAVRRRPPRSPVRRSRSQAGRCDGSAHHAARCRDQGRRAAARSQGRAAAVAAPVHLQGGDRERGTPAPARQFWRHLAAFRPDGAARPHAQGHDAWRTVPAHDGIERQRHRAGRPVGRAGPGRAPPVAARPSLPVGQPHRAGAALLPRHGARQRRLDRRDVFGSFRRGHRLAAAASRQDQSFGAQGDRRRGHAMNTAVATPLARYAARHVRFAVEGKVATITLDRPEKKNPLTFESYAELAELFRAAGKDEQVKTFVVTGAGGNFSSGGDVFEIIKP